MTVYKLLLGRGIWEICYTISTLPKHKTQIKANPSIFNKNILCSIPYPYLISSSLQNGILNFLIHLKILLWSVAFFLGRGLAHAPIRGFWVHPPSPSIIAPTFRWIEVLWVSSDIIKKQAFHTLRPFLEDALLWKTPFKGEWPSK